MEEQLTVKPKLKFLNLAKNANAVGLIRTQKKYPSKRKIEDKEEKTNKQKNKQTQSKTKL